MSNAPQSPWWHDATRNVVLNSLSNLITMRASTPSSAHQSMDLNSWCSSINQVIQSCIHSVVSGVQLYQLCNLHSYSSGGITTGQTHKPNKYYCSLCKSACNYTTYNLVPNRPLRFSVDGHCENWRARQVRLETALILIGAYKLPPAWEQPHGTVQFLQCLK